ncbi:dormancy-associated protein homolog 4-like [Papaver somniferum]|uniref:dormancy-associated protein homolog 4-like n=1 Tax=Papaver somniferum TaxID=3469 RepID=UPI000E6F538C|nr:dormancy-associated protein homolog 4-like [Papaver somniferum]
MTGCALKPPLANHSSGAGLASLTCSNLFPRVRYIVFRIICRGIMGLLENFWDDTLAGPRPENDLKKLRRYDSGPLPSSEDVPVISRSITIPKSNCSNIRVSLDDSSSSGPSSPAGSSTPGSPLSSWTSRDTKQLMRMKSTSAALERAEPRIPTVYDWMVISAIDR